MLILLGSRNGDAKRGAHLLLAYGLRRYFGLEELPEKAYGPQGKPWFPSRPGLHFNLSHSGKYALCALCDSPVGVDIEAVRPRSQRLPVFALNSAEYRWYESEGKSWECFYTLWTRKESWCKCAGESVARPRRICPPLPGEAAEPLAVHSFSGEGWRAALCSRERTAPALLWMDVTKLRAATIS